jgi:hypothetical protein
LAQYQDAQWQCLHQAWRPEAVGCVGKQKDQLPSKKATGGMKRNRYISVGFNAKKNTVKLYWIRAEDVDHDVQRATDICTLTPDEAQQLADHLLRQIKYRPMHRRISRLDLENGTHRTENDLY